MATPNWVSFNKRATVIWGNFFTVLGVVNVVCSPSGCCCCFVGVASSFSSSATDGAVVFVFLDVFFFVVFSVILFKFCEEFSVLCQYSSIKFISSSSLSLSFSPFKSLLSIRIISLRGWNKVLVVVLVVVVVHVVSAGPQIVDGTVADGVILRHVRSFADALSRFVWIEWYSARFR